MATQAAPHIRTETNGPVVAGFAIGFIVVNVAFTSLRFFTRTTILKAVGKDDWAILAATFLVLGILSYNTGMNVTKLGFLFQYRRIFHSKTLQTVCFWFIIYVCAWSAVQSTLLLLSCFPFPIIVPSMADKCLTTLPIWYFSSAMSTITDVLIFCIPLHSVWQLQLPVKQRLMVLGIFGLGFLISTLYRSVISTDPTWDNIDAAIWSAVELGVSILASNLPTLRPLLSRLRPGHGFSSGPRGRASSYILSDRHGTHKSSPNKSLAGERGARPGSVGTDELALRDMDVEGGAAAGPYATYATASSDPRGTYAPGEQENSGCIVKTTDITVNSGRR
ncbi:hypothetical protein RB599_001771 [Gaeumannomyces hyphopodioides]